MLPAAPFLGSVGAGDANKRTAIADVSPSSEAAGHQHHHPLVIEENLIHGHGTLGGGASGRLLTFALERGQQAFHLPQADTQGMGGYANVGIEADQAEKFGQLLRPNGIF
jgi:hypothetical protein